MSDRTRYYTDLKPVFADPETWTFAHVLRHWAEQRPDALCLDCPEEQFTLTYAQALAGAAHRDRRHVSRRGDRGDGHPVRPGGRIPDQDAAVVGREGDEDPAVAAEGCRLQGATARGEPARDLLPRGRLPGLAALRPHRGQVQAVAQAAPTESRAQILDAATTAFVDSLNHIITIGAVIAFVAAVLSFVLIRQKDFVVRGDAPDTSSEPEPVLAGAHVRTEEPGKHAG